MIKILLSFIFLFSLNSYAKKETQPKVVQNKVATSKVLTKPINLKLSQVKWVGSKATGSKHNGVVPIKSGTAQMKDGKVVGGTFIMDMTKLEVQDLKGKKKKDLEGHLKADDFFGVNNPKFNGKISTLKINSIKKNIAKGILTIKDIPHPIEIPFTRSGNKFTGKAIFDRTKYKIVYKSKSFFKKLLNQMDKVINDEVEIEFDIVLM